MAKRTKPEYGSFDSYPLTPEQVARALQALQFDLLEDTNTDTKASALLVLLRSFTYTTDSTARETMLNAAEEALMPYIGVVHDALDRLSVAAHQELLRVSVEQ
jgi:hypothetical protein